VACLAACHPLVERRARGCLVTNSFRIGSTRACRWRVAAVVGVSAKCPARREMRSGWRSGREQVLRATRCEACLQG